MTERVSTGRIYPPVAVQGTYLHRHVSLDEGRYEEHQHAIGKRTHEHLAHRLGPVLLSWADRDLALRPTYEPADAGWGWVFVAAVVALAVLALLWTLSGASHVA